jgi:hypothetical protein
LNGVNLAVIAATTSSAAAQMRFVHAMNGNQHKTDPIPFDLLVRESPKPANRSIPAEKAQTATQWFFSEHSRIAFENRLRPAQRLRIAFRFGERMNKFFERFAGGFRLKNGRSRYT